jgi:type II secretory ATPase GspE/PulE/Tfp pilus assembly ATPase PilB-like protein
MYNISMLPDFSALDGEALLMKLQAYCVETGVSDIHTSPEKDFVRLEIRLHGMLEALKPMSHAAYEQFVRRIKFISKLKLNVTNVPQDGQYGFQAPGRYVNVRVATLPSKFGESITLRLLDPKRGIVTLEELGFPTEMKERLGGLIRMPNGLVLVTGPTGSGKTTTLYALLKTVIGTKRHIITLEDPVEYEIAGIVQSEIESDHGFTFAAGLRSVLRHDPNIVLVGEIRDLETAQTAVDAALTGHLVLSTLHTNSAIEAIPRLLSMGVSPYTFAPALRGILAQRLVRTLSDEAKAQPTYDPLDQNIYNGRTVLPELVAVSPQLRDMILTGEQEGAMEEQAKKDGYIRMKEFGEGLIANRVTTREEVTRVTS